MAYDTTELALSRVLYGAKVWHVAKTGNDSTGVGDYAAPFLTIAKAISVGGDGDHIWIRPGTYDEAVDISQYAVHLEGLNTLTTIINCNDNGDTIRTAATNCSVRNLTLTYSGGGNAAVNDAGENRFLLLENLIVNCTDTTAKGFCIDVGPSNAIIRNVQTVSTGNGINITGNGWLIENWYHTATPANSPTADDQDVSYFDDSAYGLSCNGKGVVRNARIYVVRSAATLTGNETDAINIIGAAHVTLEDVELKANTHASETGECNAIKLRSNAALAAVHLRGVTCVVSSAGSNSKYHIQNAVGGKVIDCGGNDYDDSNVTGTITFSRADNRDGEEILTAQSLAQTRPLIINSPITATEMTVVQGDVYSVSEGTQITLSKQVNETGWPDSISTIHFSCAPNAVLTAENALALATGGIDDVALTSVTSSGGSLSLTAMQTSGLYTTTKSGRYNFWFIANKATNPKTIRTGTLTVYTADTN